jgi:hypothetical protein
VAMSSSVVFSSVPGVFMVVRWSMLEKVLGLTTLWDRPSLEAKPSRTVGGCRHDALIPAPPTADKPQLGA